MLEIQKLDHGFGERVLYNDVNLKINKGDKIGLVGENGTGKSTLIKILSGEVLCDSGELIWDKKRKVGYLDQFAKVNPNQTIFAYLETAFDDLLETACKFDQVNDAMATEKDEQKLNSLAKVSGELLDTLIERNYYEIPSKINKVAAGLGISEYNLETLMGDLSGGQRVKTMLAKLLLEQPDLLILDEPTNFLDTNHIAWLIKFLQESKNCFLIVSHDISFINQVVNKIWAIEGQRINVYTGNYDQYIRVRDERVMQHNKTAEKQTVQEEKLKDYIARNGVRASTARQAQSRQKALEKLQQNKIEIIKESVPPEICFRYKNIDNQLLIVIKNLAIGYTSVLVNGIFIKLLNGERIRIKGFNGVGKTTLFKTILKQIPALGGTININNNVVFGYYEQDHKFLNEQNTPIEEVQECFPKLTPKEVRAALAKSGVPTKRQMQPLHSLSGGERCKVQLCIITMSHCNVLLLDEPTNHLDIKAKAVLAKAINKFPGSVIFVSHENDFAALIEECREIDLTQIPQN